MRGFFSRLIIAILAAILFPVFAKAREKARMTSCLNNQKQIVTSALMYAQDHEELLPDADTFWGAVNLDKGVLVCPTAGTKIANGYDYNSLIAGKALGEVPNPEKALVVFDGTSTSGQTPNVAYATANFDFRHAGKSMIIAFLDGHVVAKKDTEIGDLSDPTRKRIFYTDFSDGVTVFSATGLPSGASTTIATVDGVPHCVLCKAASATQCQFDLPQITMGSSSNYANAIKNVILDAWNASANTTVALDYEFHMKRVTAGPAASDMDFYGSEYVRHAADCGGCGLPGYLGAGSNYHRLLDYGFANSVQTKTDYINSIGTGAWFKAGVTNGTAWRPIMRQVFQGYSPSTALKFTDIQMNFQIACRFNTAATYESFAIREFSIYKEIPNF
jgi:prepilin-type processing-associated H-X9-DG protein